MRLGERDSIIGMGRKEGSSRRIISCFIAALISFFVCVPDSYAVRLDEGRKVTRPASPPKRPKKVIKPKKKAIHRPPVTVSKKKGEKKEEELIALDFDNADIRVVLKFISEITKKNFLIDPQVKGKVTIISPTKIPVSDAYQVFLSILEIQGYAAVPSGSVVKILPAAKTREKDIETNIGKNMSGISRDDKIVTQLIPLDYADAKEIASLLTPLISKSSNIVTYGPTNTIILTDVSSNIRRLIRIIQEIDVESEEEVLSVIPIIYADASVIASKLLSTIEKGKKRGSTRPVKRKKRKRKVTQAGFPGTSAGGAGVKIIPDERTNSLIVVASREDTDLIKSLIARLDIEIPPPEAKIHVYYLENAVAEDIAKVLMGQVPQMMKGLKDKGKARKKGKRTPFSTQSSQKEGIVITPDKATNSLVIGAPQEIYESLVEIIKKLDIMRPQVLVEALIMEVSLKKAMELGVEWTAMDKPAEGTITGFAGTSMAAGKGSITELLQGGTSASGFMAGVVKGTIMWAGKPYPNVAAFIRAIQTDSDINVLATPQILTTDNEEAEIIVGEERPILARSQSDITGSSITKTYDYKDVGITLRLTPHISKGKFVRLEIFQEIKSFISQIEVGAIITTKRQAKTTVTVESGQTIVIGGLIQESRSKGGSGVPLLSRIPVLGWLFKSRSRSDDKINLMIFITPQIITSLDEIDKVTEEKRSEMERHTNGNGSKKEELEESQVEELEDKQDKQETEPL